MENEETAANPADEVVTLADARETGLAEQEANAPAEGESDDLEALAKEALGETETANPEFIEIEIDGKKLKVMTADGTPVDPDIKFGALRDADYRKKTMALSNDQKAVQQERAALQALANLQGDAAMRAADLKALDAKIRSVGSVQIADLQAQGWSDEEIQEAQYNLQQLAQQRADLTRQVSADVQNLSAYETQVIQREREVARQKAQLEDKALTPERIDYLEEFARNSGFDPNEVNRISTPLEYKMLHLADIGQKFLERQSRSGAMRAAAAGSPAKTLGGVKAGGASPDQMSPAEMARHLGYG